MRKFINYHRSGKVTTIKQKSIIKKQIYVIVYLIIKICYIKIKYDLTKKYIYYLFCHVFVKR